MERIGKQGPGTARPIKAKFRDGAVISQILRKAGRLRNSEQHRRIFLSPDGSEVQRAEQRKLDTEIVTELKKCDE